MPLTVHKDPPAYWVPVPREVEVVEEGAPAELFESARERLIAADWSEDDIAAVLRDAEERRTDEVLDADGVELQIRELSQATLQEIRRDAQRAVARQVPTHEEELEPVSPSNRGKDREVVVRRDVHREVIDPGEMIWEMTLRTFSAAVTGWRGVLDADEQPIPCDPVWRRRIAADEFRLAGWVMRLVNDRAALRAAAEVQEAQHDASFRGGGGPVLSRVGGNA
tara:strand:+ start:1870 stop:2538 length:669 start_codon:yes stop_codon:yes gene_type:complete